MKYIVCHDTDAATYYKAVKGFEDSECVLIVTNVREPIPKNIDPKNVYFVPGWHRGKHVERVKIKLGL